MNERRKVISDKRDIKFNRHLSKYESSLNKRDHPQVSYGSIYHKLSRKLTFSKDIYPHKLKGQYTVTLLLKNRSKHFLREIRLRDFIPNDFELIYTDYKKHSSTKEYSNQGVIQEWNISKLPSGKEIRITYTVKGKSNYCARNLL